MKPDERRVEVGGGLLHVAVTEQLLNVVDGHSNFDEARSGFLPEIMEAEVVNPGSSAARLG